MKPTTLLLAVTLSIQAATPPLTEDIQRDFAVAVSSALGVQAQPELTGLLRRWREQAWRERNQGEIEGTLFIVQQHRQIEALPPEQKPGARAFLNCSMILTFRQNAATDPVVKVLVDLYDRTHPALAAGTPPLTREAADSWVDLLTLARTGGFAISTADREAAARAVVRDYPTAGAERQQLVFQSIYLAAKLKGEWPVLSMEARQEQIARMRNIFYPPAMNGQMQHMLNQHSFRMMQNELNFMRQSTDTIMGSPPYFDPTCNCWKQRGGIVTEYH